MHERISEKVNNYNGKAPERSRRRLIMGIISPLATPLHDVLTDYFPASGEMKHSQSGHKCFYRC